jgi:hypothetical protein
MIAQFKEPTRRQAAPTMERNFLMATVNGQVPTRAAATLVE